MNNKENTQTKYWWLPLLFGALFVAAGIGILLFPEESYKALTTVIGIILLISGTTQLVNSINNRKYIFGFGFQLGGGVVDLVLGILLIVNPLILLKIITFFVGIWLIVSGLILVSRALDVRKEGLKGWTRELILGIFLLVLAILFFFHPEILGLTIAIWTALAFIILGIFRIILTFQLRKDRKTVTVED